MLESFEAVGGIYVAMFAIAVVSGIFPIVNSEVALVGATLATGSLPTALTLAVLMAIGQSISHGTLFFAGRGIANATSKRREKLEAKLTKARALVARWGDKWLLMIAAAALFGIPPMILVALAAGALGGVRYRALVAIGLTGRMLRFVAIALTTYLV